LETDDVGVWVAEAVKQVVSWTQSALGHAREMCAKSDAVRCQVACGWKMNALFGDTMMKWNVEGTDDESSML